MTTNITHMTYSPRYMTYKDRILRNINSLSIGDTADCGIYGRITCRTKACKTNKPRMFSVAKSTVLPNGGNWTLGRLRKAIQG
jgi:hypothetical protein